MKSSFALSCDCRLTPEISLQLGSHVEGGRDAYNHRVTKGLAEDTLKRAEWDHRYKQARKLLEELEKSAFADNSHRPEHYENGVDGAAACEHSRQHDSRTRLVERSKLSDSQP
jgi:hypothetical protein